MSKSSLDLAFLADDATGRVASFIPTTVPEAFGRKRRADLAPAPAVPADPDPSAAQPPAAPAAAPGTTPAMPGAAPAAAQLPAGGVAPVAPQAPEITPESLRDLASFAGRLVKAAEGIDPNMNENQSIARMLQDGTIGISVPLGQQPSVSLDTLKEVGADLSKNLFGYMKVIGLAVFTKVTDLRVMSGTNSTNPEFQASIFIIAFTLAP